MTAKKPRPYDQPERAEARGDPRSKRGETKISRIKDKVQKVITLSQDEILSFCGEQDRKLKKIQSRLKARIIPRGDELRLTGSPGDVETAYRMISGLLEAQRANAAELSDKQIHHALDQFDAEPGNHHFQEMLTDTIDVEVRGGRLTPLTAGQGTYLRAIREHTVTFVIGPAGTGKTYLAVAMAVEALKAGRVQRMVLVRPVVEAGEKLGFLPGDIAQKIDPYIRPLYDALYEMLEAERIREYLENGTIEIAPLAFMRGRTLSNSFIILDEAQNTSPEQMKMIMTRMGPESRMIVTGDITQVDLPKDKICGLVHAEKILRGIEGIATVRLTRKDIVRHPLVQKIIMAYESHGKKK